MRSFEVYDLILIYENTSAYYHTAWSSLTTACELTILSRIWLRRPVKVLNSWDLRWTAIVIQVVDESKHSHQNTDVPTWDVLMSHDIKNSDIIK